MNVEDVMKKGAQTVGSHKTLGHAAQIMWDHDCGCVPVVDEEGKLVAVVTDRDVCMAAMNRDETPWIMGVVKGASHDVVAVHPQDTLEAAEALMQQHHVHRLPVVDAMRRPVGILSLTDIVRESHAPHAGAERSAGIDAESVVRTLAAVCAARPKTG